MKKIVTTLLAASLVLSLAACGSSSGESTTAAATEAAASAETEAAAGEEASAEAEAAPAETNYREHLTIAYNSQITDLDPQGGGNANAVHAKLFNMTHNTLFNFNANTLELSPELATDWEWLDEECTQLHITLRDDVYFQNGEHMTAEDVAFTLDRASDVDSSISDYYDHTEIESDTEITVVLSTANVDFVYILSRPFDSIVCKAAVEADPDFGAAIGSGPWINDLDRYVAGDTIELVRFDDYWDELPLTKEITISYISNSSSCLIALESDEIQLMNGVEDTEMDIARSDPDIVVDEFPTTRLYYLAFNTSNGPAVDENLRKAISYGINKEELLMAVGDTGGVVANTFYGNAMQFYTEDLDDIVTYDPEKAKEYVALCGDNTSIKIMSNTTSSMYKTMAEVIQEQMRQIGITVEIEEVDSAGISANTRYDTATHEAMLYSIGTNTWDSDMNRLLAVGTNSNKAIVDDERISELLILSASCTDTDQRADYCHEIQQICNDKCYYVPLWYGSTTTAYRKGLAGFENDPAEYYDYSHIYMPED